MLSPVLSRFSKPPKSCLFLFFFFLFLLSTFQDLPWVLSQPEHLLCDALFECGNITVGFPFWGGSRPEACGHPSLVLHCNKSSNTTLLIISGQMYNVLQIDNSSNTLRLARQDFLSEDFCSVTFTGTTLTPELFELTPDYKILFVYYLCNPGLQYPSRFRCPKLGNASVHLNNENKENCGGMFNITVPMTYVPEEEALNLTILKNILRNGFKVKLKIEEKPCQQCKSGGRFCGYSANAPVCCKKNSSSITNCNPMIVIPSRTSDYATLPRQSLSGEAKLGIELAGGFLGATLLAGALLCFFIRRRKKLVCSLGHLKRETSHHNNLEALIQLKRYSYAQVKKITKSFSHIIGNGGFGTVYEGNLYDGRKVAVKILKDFKSNGEDFINEVASMSQTSHVNIVSLVGFCYEGSKRAIVYEFLENGSLDQFISSNMSLSLDVGTLYGIALGVARGLEYLHHGCKTRIVHFDIKPQNVLLDDNLCPKVSDFGLSKLCEKRESILSLLDTRGTIGYIAPEVFSRMYGRVSHKSDVYSYGMLVLDMIGARNKETDASNSSSSYFPDWIYKDLENEEHTWKFGDEITIEEKEIAKKMALVGLWCIHPCPSNRPPMNKVVEMMEGNLDALEVPPMASLHFSSVPLLETSSFSEENSV